MRKSKKYFLVGIVVLLVVILVVTRYGGGKTLEYTVSSRDVVESVVLSGKVATSDRADLGFASSGRVSRIFVKNNQVVSQGQILAQLEIDDLLADLKIKKLNSEVSTVGLKGVRDELEKVISEENTKIESAYRTLLSDNLVLVPDSSNYGVDAPTVDGIYNGEEGQYKISIGKKNVTFPDFWLFTLKLENTETILNEKGPTLLGTKGLYLQLGDDDIAFYKDTIWYLNIPNQSSSSYLSNFNAYNEVKKSGSLAIRSAELKYQKLLTEDGGGSSVAQAEIAKINAEIKKNTILAPFNGRVTNIEKKVGENASVGERVISVLGEKRLEIILQVSELDVSKLVPDLPVSITIDAIPGEEFFGVLKTVNLRDTEIDGVPVYEAFVELSPDPRIKTGMSAYGTVVLEERKAVVAIPSYLIEKVAGKNIVKVILEDGSIEERNVMLGLKGTDSMIEIISGLSPGEKVLESSMENN